MKKVLMMLMLSAMLYGCGEQSGKNASVQTREERIEEIAELEQKMKGKADLEQQTARSVAEQLIREYRDFVQVHGKDSLAPHYLLKAADLSVGVKKYDQAIGFINGILRDYPEWDKNVEIMLYRGFIYEQHLDQHAKAVEAYEALIQRYPNHRLAEDARASIENLTLSDEELIEKFKQKNAQNPS